MIDETAGTGEQSGAPEGNAGQTEASERVAFCQQCGRELTSATARRAGSAIFCEPCLVAKLGAGAGGPAASATPNAGAWTPVGSAGPAQGTSSAGAAGTGTAYGSGPGAPVMGAPVNLGEPNPGLAALLGLIPGVGAMYNGQYAKGVAHLVIFAILVSLSNNVNGIFGLFVAGWIFYQSFEAYHTAKARRDGLPLPNAFGFNDIGDRMGFGRNWPGSAARPVPTAPAGGWSAAPNAGPNPTPNWAGYVPPVHFGATAPPPPPAAGAQPVNTEPQAGAWSAPPYAAPQYGATYTGESWQTPGSVPGGPSPAVVPVPPPGRRFPVGAAWLIGLGVLFLLSNLAPEWRLRAHWLLPILLAALAAWLLFRRVEALREMARLSGEEYGLGPDGGRRLICQLRLPVMLLVLAALFALQAADVWTLGQTWPVLFIAYGALLVLERSMGSNTWYPPVSVPPAGSAGSATAPRAAWTAGENETRKDGQ
ncbi:MAG TPA: hypothetical protein VIJ65_04735 [Acidobacteriaceae bacterium]